MRAFLIVGTIMLLSAPAGAQRNGRAVGDAAAAGLPVAPGPVASAGSERATIMVEPVGMLIATFDSDGDGRVSRAELTTGVERTFRASDTARTGRMGYIAYADWAARWLGDADALPSPFTVDANGDNQITLPELQNALAHIFVRFDLDKDGFVTRKELLTIRSAPNGGGFAGRRDGRNRPPR